MRSSILINKKQGFTLIELIAVTGIIAIIIVVSAKAVHPWFSNKELPTAEELESVVSIAKDTYVSHRNESITSKVEYLKRNLGNITIKSKSGINVVNAKVDSMNNISNNYAINILYNHTNFSTIAHSYTTFKNCIVLYINSDNDCIGLYYYLSDGTIFRYKYDRI